MVKSTEQSQMKNVKVESVFSNEISENDFLSTFSKAIDIYLETNKIVNKTGLNKKNHIQCR